MGWPVNPTYEMVSLGPPKLGPPARREAFLMPQNTPMFVEHTAL